MSINRKTLVLDSSQLQTYGECPCRWQFSNVENLSHSVEIREDFAMGTYGHKLLEIYYDGKKRNLDAGSAAEVALAWNPDNQECECGHEFKDHQIFGEEGIPDSCKWGICPCQSWRRIRFPLAQETRDKVRKRFNDYWMTYSRQDVDPEIIEKGFSYCLLDNDEYLFILEGRIDLIGRSAGQPLFMDHKFQGRKHDLYKKSIQFRNYSLVTGLGFGLINYIRLHNEVSKDTLVRVPLNFSAFERQWWKGLLIEKFKKICREIEEAQRADRDLYREESACSGKFGIPCEFTRICEEPLTQLHPIIKKAYFKEKTPWNPW